MHYTLHIQSVLGTGAAEGAAGRAAETSGSHPLMIANKVGERMRMAFSRAQRVFRDIIAWVSKEAASFCQNDNESITTSLRHN